MQLITQTPAKVNLCLLIGPQRSDGYHELFSVFAPVDIRDELVFDLQLGPPGRKPGRLRVRCSTLDGDRAPGRGRAPGKDGAPGEDGALHEDSVLDGEANLVTKALRGLEVVVGRPIEGEVEIRKGIPIGAGLGGGSSDAAAALKAGARLLAEEGGSPLDEAVLHSLARRLGADVPFFLGEGPALGRGIGDVLEPFALPSTPLVVLMPDEALSTARVYAAFDALGGSEDHRAFSGRASRAEEAWRALTREGSRRAREATDAVRTVERVAALMENDLERASFDLLPDLAQGKQALLGAGALGALMSGSGPTLFGVCGSVEDAQASCRSLEARGYKACCALTGVETGVSP